MFSYQIESSDHQASIMLYGDLDIEVSEIVEKEIKPILTKFESVTIHLGEVPFVDSTGIGVLINLIDTLRKNNEHSQITIIEVQPLVQEVFDMIQLREILGEEVLI